MTVMAISIAIFLLLFSIFQLFKLKVESNKNGHTYTKFLYIGIILVSLFVTAWVVMQGNHQALSGFFLLIVAVVGVGKSIKRQNDR